MALQRAVKWIKKKKKSGHDIQEGNLGVISMGETKMGRAYGSKEGDSLGALPLWRQLYEPLVCLVIASGSHLMFMEHGHAAKPRDVLAVRSRTHTDWPSTFWRERHSHGGDPDFLLEEAAVTLVRHGNGEL